MGSIEENPGAAWHLDAGQVLDKRYEIIEEVGRGGMAVVYRGKDRLMEREVALKALDQQFATVEAQLERFRIEAHAYSCLDHPGIVKVMHSGLDEIGRPYLVMEWLAGRTLEAIFQAKEKIGREYFREIFMPVLDALVYAHARQIIHRDLKPANIMVCKNADEPLQVKVLDFGIAKLLERSGTEKAAEATVGFMGSPLYMSPEQVAGAPADARSDIYSLACVMYQALTGRPPFVGETALETMYEHLRKTVPSLVEISGSMDISMELVEAIIKALSKDPLKRPASMQEFKDLVSTALKSKNTIRGSKKSPAKPLLPLLALSSTVLLVVALVYFCKPAPNSSSSWQPQKKASTSSSIGGIAPLTLLREAGDLIKEKNYDQAIEKLKLTLRILRQHPNRDVYVQTHESLANVYDLAGRYDEAAREYDIVIDLYPDEAAAARLTSAKFLALAYLNLGKKEQAENTFNTYIDAAKGRLGDGGSYELANLDYEYAKFCVKAKRLDQALALCLEALRQYDETTSVRDVEGAIGSTWIIYDIYKHRGQPELGMKVVQATIRSFKEGPASADSAKLFAAHAEERGLPQIAAEMKSFAANRPGYDLTQTRDAQIFNLESVKRINEKLNSSD